MHPDGSLGGEYTSRNTQNFFPHGLEIAGAWSPEALAISDLGLRPLVEGRSPAWDERLIGHYVTSWLLAWREWREERPAPLLLPVGRQHFEEAKMLVDARSDQRLYLATSRGGAFRLFAGGRLLLADTGVTLGLQGGKAAVCHLEADNEVSLADGEIGIAGRMAYAKSARLTPFKSIVLRGLMISIGRFFPDLIRRLLQKMLVTGRNEAPFRFRRTLNWRDGRWHVRDEIIADLGWDKVRLAGIGGFQSSLTTVMARIWQPAELQKWLDLTAQVKALKPGEPLVVERTADPQAAF
jgi:hypothetical protein